MPTLRQVNVLALRGLMSNLEVDHLARWVLDTILPTGRIPLSPNCLHVARDGRDMLVKWAEQTAYPGELVIAFVDRRSIPEYAADTREDGGRIIEHVPPEARIAHDGQNRVRS